MKIPYEINIDILENVYEKIEMKQFDTGNVLKINVLINGQPLNLTNNTIRLSTIKPDNTTSYISQNTSLSNLAAGVLAFSITSNMLAVVGTCKMELTFYESTDIVTSRVFYIEVLKTIRDDQAIESTSEYTALVQTEIKAQEQINIMKKWDTDLKAVYPNLEIKYAETLEKINKKIGYKEKQTELLAKFYKTVDLQESKVTIACCGDSLTYGTDLNSTDKRDPYPAAYPDGSANTVTRASTTYPEALQSALREVYGTDKIDVVNRGRSGDWVASGYARFKYGEVHYNDNLAILNYGVNDSRNEGCPYKGDIQQFLKEYRKLIETLLDDNIPCILLGLTRMQPPDHNLINQYALAIKQLGKEYNIPVMDTEELLAGYSGKYYSDITHFNGSGYDNMGKRIASAIIGNGLIMKNIVQSHSQLLTRKQIDNCFWGTGVTKVNNTTYPTQDEWAQDKGFGVNLAAGQFIIYNFYCENDLLIAIPNIQFVQSNSKAKFTLDFGAPQPKFANDNFILRDISFSEEPSILQLNYGSLSFSGINYSLKQVMLENAQYLTIINKGWHTLKIEAIDNAVNVFGVSFLNHYDLNKINYTLNFIGQNGLNFGIGESTFLKMYYSNERLVVRENSSASPSWTVSKDEVVWGRPCRFTGQTTTPTPIKGMIYFDATASKFKKCEDGVNWTNI